MPTIDIDPLYNPFKQTQARPQQGGQAVRESSLGLGGGKVQKDWAQLYDGIETSKTTQEETLTLFDNDTLNEFADRVTMIPYHGSGSMVTEPTTDLRKTTDDFGPGFYLTDDRELASKCTCANRGC